ncbi:hypothetical protein ACF0H5_005740 [Mactra antiquata]
MATNEGVNVRRDWVTFQVSDKIRQGVMAKHCVGQDCNYGEKCCKVNGREDYECRIEECDTRNLPAGEKVLPPIDRIRNGIGAKVKVYHDRKLPPAQYHCCGDGYWKIDCNEMTTPSSSTSSPTSTSSSAPMSTISTAGPTSSSTGTPTTSTVGSTSSSTGTPTTSTAGPTSSSTGTPTTSTAGPTSSSTGTPTTSTAGPTSSSTATPTASSLTLEWHDLTSPTTKRIGFSHKGLLNWNSALDVCADSGRLAFMETFQDLDGLQTAFANDYLPEEMWLGGRQETADGKYDWVSPDGDSFTAVSPIDESMLPVDQWETSIQTTSVEEKCIYLSKDYDGVGEFVGYSLQLSPCTDVLHFLCEWDEMSS